MKDAIRSEEDKGLERMLRAALGVRQSPPKSVKVKVPKPPKENDR